MGSVNGNFSANEVEGIFKYLTEKYPKLVKEDKVG